jgi:chromosome segregation ATPase
LKFVHTEVIDCLRTRKYFEKLIRNFVELENQKSKFIKQITRQMKENKQRVAEAHIEQEKKRTDAKEREREREGVRIRKCYFNINRKESSINKGMKRKQKRKT